MSDLTTDQDELLRRLLDRPIAGESTDRLPAAGPLVPLSESQASIWFVSRLHPHSTEYNVFEWLWFEEAPEHERLARALATLMARHDALRLRLIERDGVVAQEDTGLVDPPLLWHDLRGMSQADADSEAFRLAVDATRERFAFDLAPLWKVSVVVLPDGRATVVIVIHHIIADHSSWQVLLHELTALLAGKDLPPPPSSRFVDYVASRRRRPEDHERDLDYWRRTLAGELPILDMPADRPRPATASREGHIEPMTLSADVVESARALARQEGTTLFVVMLAAFNVFLARMTRQDDVIVGTALAGRDDPEAEALVGCFVRLVPLRSRVDASDSYRGLIRSVHTTVVDALDHQRVPFPDIVAALTLPRDPSVHPIAQAYFGMQTAEATTYPGARVGSMALGENNGTGRWELGLTLTEEPDGVSGLIEGFADLFDRATVRRFADIFLTLLPRLLGEPDLPVSSHSLLTEEERERMVRLHPYERPDHPYVTLAEPFEEQVARTPEATALVHGDKTVTYDELNRSANRLARFLRSQGAGPGSRVAICLERGIPQVVSMYAVSKSGAAFVPLETELPDARIAFMLDDTEPALVLTDGATRDRLAEGSWQVVCIDEEEERWAHLDTGNLPAEGPTNNFSHLLYTSGSTGRPKAVALAVDGAVAEVMWAQQHYPYGPGDATVFMTSFGFDVALLEVFWPLYFGATLVVCDPGRHRDVDHVRELLDRHRITGQWIVPTLLQAVLDGISPGSFSSLRYVFSGGEPITPRLRDAFHLLLDAQLVNLYGPTETGGATDMVVPREPGAPVVPLGRPASNFRVYVLDSELEPVPVGVPGEAYIAAEVGISHAYFRRPALTAERYLPDPFGLPGGRMYRTGDVCRYRPDGVLEHLGRIGRQVKVRGMRIELAEVEAVLCEHPEVQECTVLPVRWNDVENLIGFVVARTNSGVAVADVYEHAKRLLPRHMVPGAIEVVEAIPLNVNGKVDQGSLLARWSGRFAPENREVVAPADPVEEVIAGIFCDLLELPEVSVTDSFFELGGHSLLIFRLIAAVDEEFGVAPDVADVFSAPTIRELAASLKTVLAS